MATWPWGRQLCPLVVSSIYHILFKLLFFGLIPDTKNLSRFLLHLMPFFVLVTVVQFWFYIYFKLHKNCIYYFSQPKFTYMTNLFHPLLFISSRRFFICHHTPPLPKGFLPLSFSFLYTSEKADLWLTDSLGFCFHEVPSHLYFWRVFSLHLNYNLKFFSFWFCKDAKTSGFHCFCWIIIWWT